MYFYFSALYRTLSIATSAVFLSEYYSVLALSCRARESVTQKKRESHKTIMDRF